MVRFWLAMDIPGSDLSFLDRKPYVCLQSQEHPTFRRKGADLVIEKNLTLVEALCGFDFSITHMDKRTLRVKSNPGQVPRSAIALPMAQEAHSGLHKMLDECRSGLKEHDSSLELMVVVLMIK